MRQCIRDIYLVLREIFLNIVCARWSPPVAPPAAETVQRILCIRTDRNGDLVLSTPLFKALRRHFPSAAITLMTSPVAADLVKGADYVDQVLEYRPGTHIPQGQYDLVFDLMGDYTLKSAWLAYRSGARYRVGFDVRGRGVFFNLKVRSVFDGRHFIDQMADLLTAVGIRLDDRTPELPVRPEARESVTEFLEAHTVDSDGQVVCIHPGGFYKTQRWFPQRFAEVADLLIEKYGVTVVLMGSRQETDLVESIQEYMTYEAAMFLGRPLSHWVALIDRAQMLLCNNSGPLHMAVAVGTPTVSTMGPTYARRWWPHGSQHKVLRKDIPCIGCGQGSCPTQTMDCMRFILVKDIMTAVDQVMPSRLVTQELVELNEYTVV